MPVSPYQLFEKIVLALGLAFFFGVVFEDYYGRAKEVRPGGVRTFPLLALTGAVLYLLDPAHFIPLSVGLAVVGSWLAVYYVRRTGQKNAEGQAAVGLMVPVCNVIAFLLGPAAIAEAPWVSSGVTAAAVLFLTSRERLHRFARQIELSELATAGKFLVLTGLVLPLLPDHAVTSLTEITPRQAWLALIAVSSISYASYLLQKYALPRGGGSLVTALLGGLYSSTATATALARQMTDATSDRERQGGIVLSTAVMYMRVLVMVGIFNIDLALRLFVPLFSLFAIAAVMGGLIYGIRAKEPVTSAPSPPENPLALSTAAIFAALFVGISIATSWARSSLGTGGLYSLAAIVGFADVDPFVLNLAEGGGDKIPLHSATAAVVLAASSNNLLKSVYVMLLAGRRGGLVPAGCLGLLAGVGALVSLSFMRG